jgi:molecular chaperone GrpE (heat shock protein)
VTVAHLQDRVSEGHADRARVEEKWHRSQEQASAWEEEVTQCRAHVDLFKIRLEEEHEEKERLKVRRVCAPPLPLPAAR